MAQKMYAVQVNVEWRSPSGVSGSRQLPTFYLHPNVQGITSGPQAAHVARLLVGEIVGATEGAIGQGPPFQVVPHVSVIEVWTD